MTSTPSTILAALGVPARGQGIYDRVVGVSGSSTQTIATMIGVPVEDLAGALDDLVEVGAVVTDGETVVVREPGAVVAHQLGRWAGEARATQRRLESMAQAMHDLDAAGLRPSPGSVDVVGALDGEVSRGGQPIPLLRDLIGRSAGELRWFRPDQFQPPREDAMAEIVGAAIAGGRESRAIYPARALHEAPETLRRRAEVGERIRLVADLPTRMIVIGGTHAVLPEPLGFVDEPRLLVRQPAVVQACGLLFESYWERAVPVAELERGVARPDLRRYVLQQLAAGVQDEQVARTLGVSLRTVRRRIADLMSELGADTRFQAGVEAGRRGWL